MSLLRLHHPRPRRPRTPGRSRQTIPAPYGRVWGGWTTQDKEKAMNAALVPTNGVVIDRKPRKSKSRSQERKLRAPARKRWGKRKVSAGILGAIGIALLALSLSHCTEAIALLTGSGKLLSLLLALGIDAGMVAAEWAMLTGARDEEVKSWSNGYIVATVALSVLLNCYAFGLHSAEGMRWAAWTLGAFVRAAVYTL